MCHRSAPEVSDEYSVWCPAMRLDPMPQSVKRLLSPGDTEPLSPVLSLDPGACCDPERVDLGLQPLLGTMVHVSQVSMAHAHCALKPQACKCADTPLIHRLIGSISAS